MAQPTPQLPECSDGQSAGTDLGHGIPGASFEYSPLLLGPLDTTGAQSAHPHATATLAIAPRRRNTTSLVSQRFTASFYPSDSDRRTGTDNPSGIGPAILNR